MEQFNPRTQGFNDETKQSFSSFLASKKAQGYTCIKREVKERVDTETGNVIPAHKALCFFIAKKGADGTAMRGANGGLVAEPNTMFHINFGPSVSEETSVADLKAQANDLEVGQLKSGNWSLYRPNYNGLVGEEL